MPRSYFVVKAENASKIVSRLNESLPPFLFRGKPTGFKQKSDPHMLYCLSLDLSHTIIPISEISRLVLQEVQSLAQGYLGLKSRSV